MVREFAEEQVKPHVMEMDRAAKIPQELITQLFNLGVMGIGNSGQLRGLWLQLLHVHSGH